MPRNKAVLAAVLGFIFLTLGAGFLNAAEIAYDAGKRRDPFVPLNGAEGASVTGSSSGFKLEGIIYDPGARSMVILNGKSYLAGDSVEDTTIVKIEKDYVVISADGEEKTLRMREEPLPASSEGQAKEA